MNIVNKQDVISPKDYASEQEIRWCPGCGDYAILKAMQKMLADIAAPRERTVFVSGIGCSSRFPYYMATYGFHTIHGRAPAIATGVKLANPDLDVWVVTGDGDALSIGGNHLIHALRRNIDLQILMFNNEIYGLTKGQYSPTSRPGTVSPSSPKGSVERPLSAAQLALGAGGRFVARSVDTMQSHLIEVLKSCQAFRGCSFVEIFQNCIVYNDGVFAEFTDLKRAPDSQIFVEHGKPLLFGEDLSLGLRLRPGTFALEKVRVGGDVSLAEIQVYDATNRVLATMVSDMRPPQLPMALGVLYRDAEPASPALGMTGQERVGSEDLRDRLNAVLRAGETWEIG